MVAEQARERAPLCGECLHYRTPTCENSHLAYDMMFPTDTATCKRFYPLQDRVKRFMRDKNKMVAWVKNKSEGKDSFDTWRALYCK